MDDPEGITQIISRPIIFFNPRLSFLLSILVVKRHRSYIKRWKKYLTRRTTPQNSERPPGRQLKRRTRGNKNENNKKKSTKSHRRDHDVDPRKRLRSDCSGDDKTSGNACSRKDILKEKEGALRNKRESRMTIHELAWMRWCISSHNKIEKYKNQKKKRQKATHNEVHAPSMYLLRRYIFRKIQSIQGRKRGSKGGVGGRQLGILGGGSLGTYDMTFS